MFQLSVGFTAICIEIFKSSVWFSGLMARRLCIAQEETEAQPLRALPGLGLEGKNLLTHSSELTLAESWKDQLVPSRRRSRPLPEASLCVSPLPWSSLGYSPGSLPGATLFLITFCCTLKLFLYCSFKSWLSSAVAGFLTHASLLPVTRAHTYRHAHVHSHIERPDVTVGPIICLQPAPLLSEDDSVQVVIPV